MYLVWPNESFQTGNIATGLMAHSRMAKASANSLALLHIWTALIQLVLQKKKSVIVFFPPNFFICAGLKHFSCVGLCGLYLCEAQLGCMRGAGTLFSSWIMVSRSVEMVRTLEPLIEPFHLNSPAGVMQNLWERCRLLSWSWEKQKNNTLTDQNFGIFN